MSTSPGPAVSRRGAPRRPVPADLLTIGELLTVLQVEFPDVSHSKVRFLEERGLVTPARTPSGYRKFSRRDVERLRLVLSLQRDHYLPLRVIGEHVAALDAGQAPPRLPGAGYGGDLAEQAAAPPDPAAAAQHLRTVAVREVPTGGVRGPVDPLRAHPWAEDSAGHHTAPDGTSTPTSEDDVADLAEPAPSGGTAQARSGARGSARLSRAEVVALAGGDVVLVDDLESHGLLPRPGSHGSSEEGYSAEVAEVVAAARELTRSGIEPRHLRVLRTAAEREATLVEQVVSPLRRSQRPGTAERATEVAGELAEVLMRLHGSLLRTALDAPGR